MFSLDDKGTKAFTDRFVQFAYSYFSLWCHHCFDIVFMGATVWSGLSLFFLSHSLSLLVQGDALSFACVPLRAGVFVYQVIHTA